MRPRIDELQTFYDSWLGEVCAEMVQRRLRTLWPDLTNQDVLGLGYCPPYFSTRFMSAHRILCAMPRGQGVCRWRRGTLTSSVLCEDTGLPFADESFDRVLVVHGLDNADYPKGMLAEVTRILRPEGRAAIITANRGGLWARSDRSPFGMGRPFSRQQMAVALREAGLQPTVWSGALYAPPWFFPKARAYFDAWEGLGSKFWSGFSGLVLVEALKRLYADSNGRASERAVPEGTLVGESSALNAHHSGWHKVIVT